MKGIKATYGTFVVLLMSVAVLSSQGTFDVLHTLLHKIPNPFHYHTTETDFVYHHETSRSHSFFEHESHGHSHRHGYHSLEDHLALHQKDIAKSPSKEKDSKKEVEKSSKNPLFWQAIASDRFIGMFNAVYKWSLYASPFLASSISTPPSPPPEHFR